MIDLKDLAFSFHESHAVKLFKKVRKLAKPSFEVPESIKDEIERYLKVTEEYCNSELIIGKDRYYRAHKHDFDQLKNFSKKNMGPPSPELASIGRAQMAGVSVLYLADNPKGKCFAFFDQTRFQCTQTRLHKVKSVQVKAERMVLSKLDKRYLAKQKS